VLGAAGLDGPELGGSEEDPWFRVGAFTLHGVRYRGAAIMETDVRLRAMDVAGINFQVVSPNPLSYLYDIDLYGARSYCRVHNDAVSTIVREHPSRLGGLATLPMQNVQIAIEELRRSVLELGLLGASVGTDLGVALDAPELDPLYEAVAALDVPLFLHPAPPSMGATIRDARLSRFDLDLTVGFAYEETLAAVTLVAGGVLDRHPTLDVCLSHGGGTTAFLLEKLSLAASRRAWSPPWLRADGAFQERVRRIWFDSLVHGDASLDALRRSVGTQRLVLGTNFGGWDQRSLALASGVLDELSENAVRLLRLDVRDVGTASGPPTFGAP
jgi:aminocarboxymuconate-semialdehyde decarboxylase